LNKLFLFDIDGTLVRGAGPQHAAALVAAIRQVLGVETTLDGIPVHGMLDRDILRDMLRAGGFDDARINTALPAIVAAAQELYPPTCPDISAKVLPGVREVLSEIRALEFPIGLVTGNLTRIGWTKMERAGLREFFSFGAFSDMGATRGDLARIAVELSGETGCLVTMTGDAPSDVAAAKSNGFRSVSVATGISPRETLAALQPDLLLNDLSRPEDRRALIGD
jgi:phosphoglycolate phosphatase-like HAD superfamily hydrolase